MKTYHVFIASSLSFQKERDLMEKVLTERNNSELNIVGTGTKKMETTI